MTSDNECAGKSDSGTRRPSNFDSTHRPSLKAIAMRRKQSKTSEYIIFLHRLTHLFLSAFENIWGTHWSRCVCPSEKWLPSRSSFCRQKLRHVCYKNIFFTSEFSVRAHNFLNGVGQMPCTHSFCSLLLCKTRKKSQRFSDTPLRIQSTSHNPFVPNLLTTYSHKFPPLLAASVLC